jgi:hypothetical protein
METFEHFDELSRCQHLFLDELLEPQTNILRILLIEGKPSRVAVPIEVAGQSLGEGFPVEVDTNSPKFELTWNSYVLYQVMNESFGQQETSKDGVVGTSASIYRSSSLLDYVFRRSNASDEFPGKLLHFKIVCADHVVDVISRDRPECRRVGPKLRMH